MAQDDQKKTINNVYQSWLRNDENIIAKFQSAIILRSSNPIAFDKALIIFMKGKYENSAVVYGDKYNLLAFFETFYKHDGVASTAVQQFIDFLRDNTSVDLQVCSMYIPIAMKDQVELFC